MTTLETYPWGWFVVTFSDQLSPGAVRPLRHFGRELVLFRAESGAASILDAHCPHMGAHLGHGGVVEGGAIKCPFHAWKFDGAGACTDVPYATRIPPRATIACWPTCEVNGMVFVWHHPRRQPPSYEIPVITEVGDPEWTAWDHSELIVQTHPREIVENVADLGHFIPVHGTHVAKFDNEYVGHLAKQINEGTAYPLGGREDRYRLRATYHGPAYQVTQMEGALESRLVNAHTPIDEHSLILRFAVSLKVPGDRTHAAAFTRRYIDNLREGFLQDIRIWEHKVFRERALLCDGDGPIGKLRRWYRQFYEEAAS